MGGVRQTSREAYRGVDLKSRQAEVLHAIERLEARRFKVCDGDIAAELGWEINRVTPRRGELVDLGLIEKGGTKKNRRNRTVNWWRTKPVQPPLFGDLPKMSRETRRP